MKQVYIIIGPSGIGKTTIGKLLSNRLHLPFYDADDFHSETNILKMKNGTALNDRDRMPWLNELAENIKRWHVAGGAVLACSALKERYRKMLVSVVQENITWIYLYGDSKIIQRRLSMRKGHFFNKELLVAQYRDLEIPKYGCHIDVSRAPEQIVDEIINCINAN